MHISTSIGEYEDKEVEISEETWPDIVSSVKVIHIELDRYSLVSQQIASIAGPYLIPVCTLVRQDYEEDIRDARKIIVALSNVES